MAWRSITLVGLLYLAQFTSYLSAKSSSYLSCTSSYSEDFAILDCYYRGGLPFPTLTWSGPNNLYRETSNTPRFTINISKHEFVDEWNTIYKCTAGHRYSYSYCYIGRGIGSYIGIAFGALALLFVLCVLSLCIWVQCDKLCEKFARSRRKRETASATTTGPSYDNPTFINEPSRDVMTPE
ncbi:hypothetical protein chiPu_0011377 [Chiloscyllium punctatum]|uniref:Ig-like domain-containing protein n=1 Tax=Chiloscyllium punctatum TaxID=137246 RepID=A0A401SRD6_CHIPU|nr:hypothetical protein [Chiloscyllium punctatum]